jgi:hypothetical protein
MSDHKNPHGIAGLRDVLRELRERQQAVTGHLCRSRLRRLPILADALEDAGCDSAKVLAHLRGEGPHVRGCWAVDLILGKT